VVFIGIKSGMPGKNPILAMELPNEKQKKCAFHQTVRWGSKIFGFLSMGTKNCQIGSKNEKKKVNPASDNTPSSVLLKAKMKTTENTSSSRVVPPPPPTNLRIVTVGN
jgi:hypothetical protein